MPADEPARSQRKGEARRQQRRSDHQVRGRRQHGAAAPNGDAAERDLQNEQGEGQEGGTLEVAVAPVGAAPTAAIATTESTTTTNSTPPTMGGKNRPNDSGQSGTASP